MKGVVLLSHGPLAKGMYETTKWFMGECIPQYTYLCLEESESPESFDNKIKTSISLVDSGEGVILICDLKGGTPCNRSIVFINEKVELLSGMNLSLVLELLGNRLSGVYDYKELINTAREGISDINSLVNTANEDDE